MLGFKHLVECNCILPQYKDKLTPVFHQFQVFSLIDENGNFVESNVQCDNCGIIHRVIEMCKSELLIGKETSKAVETIKDVQHFLPKHVISILEDYHCEIADYQYIKYCIETNSLENFIILTREQEEDGTIVGKILKYKGNDKFAIEPYLINKEIKNE